MHTERVWQRIRKRGVEPTPAERRFVERRLERLSGGPDDETDVEDAVADATAWIADLRATGLSAPPVEVHLEGARDDARWQLLRRLEQARGNDDWSALQIRGGGWMVDVAGTGPRTARPLEVVIDPRIPFRTLAQALGRMWPALRKAGAVHASRPLGDRKAALVGFVCLDKPEASWQERLDAWNRKHSAWAYGSTQALQTALHDAEQSLTGDRHGLAYYYSAKARLNRRDLLALARQGDRDAIGELRRRQEASEAWVKAAGGEVVKAEGGETKKKGKNKNVAPTRARKAGKK